MQHQKEPSRKVRGRFSGLSSQVDPVISEPSSFEEATKHQVWKDAMLEKYKAILINDVWEVVPRPQGKSMVTSKWIYKVKYSANGSVEKCNARGFLRRKILIMKRPLPRLQDITLLGLLSL